MGETSRSSSLGVLWTGEMVVVIIAIVVKKGGCRRVGFQVELTNIHI